MPDEALIVLKELGFHPGNQTVRIIGLSLSEISTLRRQSGGGRSPIRSLHTRLIFTFSMGCAIVLFRRDAERVIFPSSHTLPGMMAEGLFQFGLVSV